MVPSKNVVRHLAKAAMQVVTSATEGSPAHGALFDALVGDIEQLLDVEEEQAIGCAEQLVAVARLKGAARPAIAG